MQKVFIAYGTREYKGSLRRIGKEAHKLGIFSKIILYTEKDLPPYILASPLKAYNRGDGYWIWKPFLIWRTMQEYPNSIIVYADSGCTLKPNYEEWNSWFSLLNSYSTLAFQLRPFFKDNNDPHKTISLDERVWSKQSLIDYFNPIIKDKEWINTPQICSGLILACRNSPVIKMWLDISLMHPELVIDCFGSEIESEAAYFQEHRHDQSVWSATCKYWMDKGNIIKVIEETLESDPSAAVVATRIKVLKNPIPLKTRMITLISNRFGRELYNDIHRRVKDNKLFRRLALFVEHKGANNRK